VERYFERLEGELDKAIAIASAAKQRGDDPESYCEIPPAKDIAERVENLLGIGGLARHLRALDERLSSREEVALQLGVDIATGKVCEFPSRLRALESGVRAAVALLTEGVVAAPLEGIARIEIDRNDDGTEFVRIYYAGPIRSAGGTAQALSVLVADYIRRHLNIDRYKPRQEEIERYVAEIPAYERLVNLQYLPTDEEIRTIVESCPVCIDGEGTEREMVEGYAHIPRVSTPYIRGGMALVIAEGIALKAPKLKKYVSKLHLDGWEFVDRLIHEPSAPSGEDENGEGEVGIQPRMKYMQDMLAGRPVFSHPMAKGGFRLRYGRSRNTGFAAAGVHPATMAVLGEFLACGTQMKVERPGKAAGIAPVDSIEGPTVLLHDGSVVKIETVEQAERLRGSIKKILDVGEILINYGDFLENNHPLVPSGYCVEWWEQELVRAGGSVPEHVDEDTAWRLSEQWGIPLHPAYTFMWHDITSEDVLFLREYLAPLFREGSVRKEDPLCTLRIPVSTDDEFRRAKHILEVLLVPHTVEEGYVVVRHATTLYRCLGIGKEVPPAKDTLSLVSELAGVRIRNRAPVRIGARMGRPEKSKERKMQPPPHVLFPLGEAGGRERLFREALDRGGILDVEVRTMVCPECGKQSFRARCSSCGVRTQPVGRCAAHGVQVGTDVCSVCGQPLKAYGQQKIDLKAYLGEVLQRLGEREPQGLKGVIGLTSGSKVPEPLEKGVLRAKHSLSVFKDGTIRYDMTDLPLTHFIPREIGVDVDTLRRLGYEHDIEGKPLTSEEQVVELFVQDIIVPHSCGDYLLKVSRFVDDLLVKYYGMEPFYNASSREDLIGHLVIGLAPHTSAGVLGRLIGFTSASVGYAHPFFHAAKRRNCDGDEDCVMLLMDGLLNFSRRYLPDKRGGKMDAPLVLTTRINPIEIDSEAHNMDVDARYPLEFYEAAQRLANPKQLQGVVHTVKDYLGTPRQYTGISFTHPTSDIASGPKNSAYKVLGTMAEKMEAQLELARMLRCVDERDVAERIIKSHFLPDLIGNLREFSRQRVRCVKCNAKYRRPPLSGVCTKCGGGLTLMVHEGSVKKYLEMSLRVAEQYNVSSYTQQRLKLIAEDIAEMFDNERTKQVDLSEFM